MRKILAAAAAAVLILAAEAGATDRTEDLAAFQSGFIDKDKSYAPDDRAAAERLLADLGKEATSLSDAEFELSIARIAALADNGHTIFFPGSFQKKFNRIPLKFVVLDGRLRVGEADDRNADLVGARADRIGRLSWPAAQKRLARHQGGEPVGDRLEFWAEGDLVTLPQSGAVILYATERHNYQTGCPEPDCHAPIRDHPIRVESLAPDVPVAMTYDAFAEGVDPMMDAILEMIDASN